MNEKFTNNADITAAGKKYTMDTYGQYEVGMVKGEGSYLWDADGKKYIDLLQGVAVNALGHCYPDVVKATQEQAATLTQCANYFYIEPGVRLAKIIIENSCMDKVFFSNSGAESNEGAMKLARKYQKMNGHPERYEVISFKQSFHGRTLATLTATGQDKSHLGFDPLPAGFRYAILNDMDSVKQEYNANTAAVIIEPVQGEGGVIPCTKEFLEELRAFCTEKDIVLIFDEVQVGCGRTGHLFAYQGYGVEPDVMTLAKALGNGIPIGAFCARGKFAEVLQPGNHGTTYGGNPIATATAAAALTAIIENKLPERALEMGEYLQGKLNEMKKKHPVIKEVRGRGLIVGAVLDLEDAHVVTNPCFEKGLILNCTAGNVLRFVPALNIPKETLDDALAILEEVLTEIGK
ncbi:aspartate aminotransferase family protein [Peptoniphilus raoultii]|uniref:aspartate aminotransferase family protein n=1 Tax=Peptoniphilus raoultii TaxID=1776387 RepID=UPI0008D8EF2A|nr:aspartate aminotransferase family protein [Peptoniphilus raoultii]